MTRLHSMLLSAVSHVAMLPAAFDTGTPGWKMDGDKLALDASGNPVYIQADGREMTVQADTIGRLNSEARGHRERAETAEKALKAFEGLDAATAKTAIEKMSKIDAKQLIDAGEVDKVEQRYKDQFGAQIAEKDKALSERENEIKSLKIGGAFQASDFLRDRVAMPRDMVEAYFRNSFDLDDKGRVFAKGPDGQPVLSQKTVGEYAGPDEALEIMINRHPQKDMILKAPEAGGSGNGGGGGGRGGNRTMTRGQFNGLDPKGQIDAAAQAQKGELNIVD